MPSQLSDRAANTLGLGQRTVRGGLTLLGSHGLQLLMTIAATVVLARLLTPHDFGLYAMAALLIGIVAPLKDFGFPLALTQSQAAPALFNKSLNRLFWLNLALSTLLALTVAGLGLPLAWFFNQPALSTMVPVLAFGIWVRGTANLQLGLLRRQLRFGTIAAIDLAALLAGAAVGIAIALAAASPWALVAQHLTVLISQSGLLWWFGRWRPGLLLAGANDTQRYLRTITDYGKNTSLARLLGELGHHADRLLIGRFLGTEALGLYQNALRWAELPVLQLLQPLKTAAVASFSRLQDQPARYRTYATSAFTVTFTLAIPGLVFLFLIADRVILLLLGTQWLAAIPLFQLLLIMALFDCFSRMTKWVYLAEGQTRRRLRWALGATPCIIAAMALGIPWGAAGVAAGYGIAKALLIVPEVAYCLRPSALRQRDFWGPSLRPALAASSAAGALFWLRALAPNIADDGWWIMVDASLFALAYVICWLLFPGGLRTARDLLAALKSTRAIS